MKKYIVPIQMILVALLFIQCEDKGPITDVVQFPRIEAIDSDATEADGKLKATVKLSWEYTEDVQVNYSIVSLEEESAKSDIDFVSQSGTIVFPKGSTVQEIEVEIIDDVLTEANEQFQIELSDAVLGKILDGVGLLTILDDDGEFVIEDVGYQAPEEYQGFTRLWEDEFEENVINPDIWTHEIGGSGWGNNELQHYTDRTTNSFQVGGYMVIEAKEEGFGGNDYTSARIVSQDKFEFSYGRADIRAKVPEGKGIWPALWMLGGDFAEVGWPTCGEIDIMEIIGSQPQILHGTIHYPLPSGQAFFKGGSTFLSGAEKFSKEFHVYSIIWKEDQIEWLVDGVSYLTLTPADIEDGIWSYNDDPFFFILNVAVGGNWPGSPDETTVFPQRMLIDYVRVYQAG